MASADSFTRSMPKRKWPTAPSPSSPSLSVTRQSHKPRVGVSEKSSAPSVSSRCTSPFTARSCPDSVLRPFRGGFMRRNLTVFVLLVVSVLYSCSASAQDMRAFGVTMGYPASVGLLWHVTEGVAVRPEFAFDFFSSETENSSPIIGGDSSQDGHTLSVGISALFYLARWDMTRAYVVPRYAYSDISSSIDGPATIVRDSSGNAHDVSVSFGAQHNLGERFAIYGELGLAYERFTTDIIASELRRSSFGTRSGVGVVVYF